jgi:membrane protein YqaA with SNARE-associated domain
VGARRWATIVGVVLLALFITGMIQSALQEFPPEQLLLGLIPLNSPGHVLHAVTGGIALYLGVTRP